MRFLKKLALPHKATPTELSEVHARLDAEMCGFTQKWALDSLGIDRLLPLLNIADNEKLGATKAILYAYRFGYLEGKAILPKNLNIHHEEHNEALKEKIIDIVQSVDETWLLSLILRTIKCVTEKRWKMASDLMERERGYWKQSIIEIINKIDNIEYLMKIYYFVKVFLD